MPRFHNIGNNQLRNFYSIDIEKENDTRTVYFNSSIHVNKRVKIGPNYNSDFSYGEILKDVLPYAMRQFGNDIIHCPHCTK